MNTTKTIHVGYFDDGTATVKVQVLGTVTPWEYQHEPLKLLARRFHLSPRTVSIGGNFTSYGPLFLADPEDIKEIKTEEVPE